jgi:defect-in-organelle-trafficking protein DotB
MSTFSTGHDNSVFEFSGSFDRDQFDECLLWCEGKKASDIRLQSGLPVKADIGGKIVSVTHRPVTNPEMMEIVKHIYGENGPAELKRGHDLDPAHEIRVPGRGRVRFRVNITAGRGPGGGEVSITIRTLPDIPPRLEELGIEDDITANLRPKDGLILVTGPTGSGKSTLLSAGMRSILEKEDANEALLEYSKPVEYVYDKVTMPSSIVHQVNVGSDLRPKGSDNDESSEFAYAARNALRRKPTIVLIGEARDKATTQACLEITLTGHLCFSTMHTIGVAETIRRAIMPFPGNERRSIAIDFLECMRMIVTQILVDKVGGGKQAIREFLVFDKDVREKLLNVGEVEDLPKAARALMLEGNVTGQTMATAAERLFAAGKITPDTLRRVRAHANTSEDN